MSAARVRRNPCSPRLALALLLILGGTPVGALSARGATVTPEAKEAPRIHVVEPAASPATGPDGASRGRVALLLAGYCTLIVAASLVGGFLPAWIELTHTRLQYMMSFVGGLMLGIGVFHMLPHAVHELGSTERAATWLMLGLVSMFFLIRAFHFHQHGPAAPPHVAECGHDHDHDGGTVLPVLQDHDHDHDHGRGNGHAHGHGAAHELSWLGVAIGLSVHTLIDGLALGASLEADAGHGALWSLFGLQTFLAIVLHKPLDAVSITSLMAAGGWSLRARTLVNAGFALMCPLGAVAFVLGLRNLGGMQGTVVGCALAFSAGAFLCISLGDLLPEMEFHDHHRVPLSLLLLGGIGLAWAIEQTHEHEGGHDHAHAAPHAAAPAQGPTTHDGHAHPHDHDRSAEPGPHR